VDETFPGLRADQSGEFPPTLGPSQAAIAASESAGVPVGASASAPAMTTPVSSATFPAPAPERSYLPVVAVVVGIIFVIAAALYVFRDPGSATIHLTTEPKDAVVTVDGKRVSASSSPFVISDVKAGIDHSIRVEKPGFSGWSTKLRVHANQQLDLPAVTLEPSAAATPPAAAAEQAPSPAPAPVPAPVPDVAHAPQTAPVPPVAAPSSAAAGARPQPHHALPTPAPAPAPKAARAHAKPEAAPVAPTHAPATHAATAGAGGGASKGTLRVNTRPWSRVFVDGKLIGNTPQMNITLPAGKHQLKLVNPDFGMTKTLSVEIGAGQVVTKVLQLQN
jgi:eukaryotic-like serine/threonine-protein kinase